MHPLGRLLILLSLPLVARTQPDENLYEANRLRKAFPDDRVAALRSEETYRFDRARTEDKRPVVTATCEMGIDFVALREQSTLQYYDFYNSFSRITAFRQLELQKNLLGIKKTHQVGTAIDRSASSSDFFSDDSRVKYFNIRFRGLGDATRIESEKKYNDSKYVTSVYFHSFFPAQERIIRIHVPNWLKLDIREFNFSGYKVLRQRNVEKDAIVYTYRLQQVPALADETRAPGIAHHYPHLVLVVNSFEFDGKKEQGFANTSDLYRWYRFLYLRSQNQPEQLRDIVNELTRDRSSDLEKARAILYWVQDHIRYIAFEDGLAGFIPAPVQDVYRYKYGDCKGMANLITEMLKLAGIPAYMSWIGTRHIPYDYSLPSLAVDNHCISTATIDGRTYYLDGTEGFMPLGEYAWRIQGKEVLIGKGESYEVKKIPLMDVETNRMRTETSFRLSDNLLRGHVKVTLTGEQRTRFHQYYHDLPTDQKRTVVQHFLEFGNRNLSVSNVRTSDLNDRELPVVLEGDIDLSNSMITEGKEIYLGIDFFPEDLRELVPGTGRQQDFELHSAYVTEDVTELILPPGYRIASLPPPLEEKQTDYVISASYTVSDNRIRFRKILSFPTGRIRQADFENWTAFTRRLADFNSNLILIRKP
ncbi:MAG: hypothetical protein RJA57_402 [Bacteroidota bacterium]